MAPAIKHEIHIYNTAPYRPQIKVCAPMGFLRSFTGCSGEYEEAFGCGRGAVISICRGFIYYGGE